MISMAVDHTGAVLVPFGSLYLGMRIAGRLAFPIYCFLLTQGLIHTRSWKRYLVRLTLFGLLSEIPFDWAISGRLFHPQMQNVYFTLALGLGAMAFVRYGTGRLSWEQRLILGGAGAMAAAWILKTDYSFRGILLILALYLVQSSPVKRGLVPVIYGLVFGQWMELGAYAITGLLLFFYNGQKGKSRLGYLYYAFYPLHLLALSFLRQWLLG